MRKMILLLGMAVANFVNAQDECFFSSEIAFMAYTDTSVTITWQGAGTYEIEYGLAIYEQGQGGTTLPLFTSETEENEYVISDLTPGKSYQIYVKKVCSETDSSEWKTIIVGTFISDTVMEFPYLEDFDNTDNKGWWMITRGWINLSSSVAHSYWGNFQNPLPENEWNGNASVRDWAGGANNKTVYSRPLQLTEGYTYTISFDYELLWLGEGWLLDSENHPTLNILINSSVDENGIAISSITSISNSATQTHSFEFTPETSGVYYFGLNVLFPQNPTQDPQWANAAGLNWLQVDNFMVAEDDGLSVNNFVASTEIMVYPNPFNDFIMLKSNSAIEKVEIYDLKGSLLYENKLGINETNINVSDLNTGVYLMRVISDNKTATHKIIKQ